MRPHPYPPQRAATTWAVAVAGLVVLVGCQVPSDEAGITTTTVAPSAGEPRAAWSIPAPTGIPGAGEPVAGDVASAADRLASTGGDAPAAPEVDRLAMSGDLRQGWLLVDTLRFHPDADIVQQGLESLTGHVPPEGTDPWLFYSDLLLSWDVPAPPGYLEDKRAVFVAHDPEWRPFFVEGAAVDWRATSWVGGGRDATAPLEYPEVVESSTEGAWLPDDDVVFGVVVGGEARAYPQRVLQVHQVVNDTLGGQPIAVSYCAATGAAVAHHRAVGLDGEPLLDDGASLHLRATGLAERGTTLLSDRETQSVFRQLDGAALGGRLHDDGVQLQPIEVRVTTWGAWRAAFPDSTVISDDAGVGRVYVADPLGQSAGPSQVPIGPVDDRLPADARVLATVAPDGTAAAFLVADAVSELDAGGAVEIAGVRVVRDAGGLAAVSVEGEAPLPAVETQWFAWSALSPTAVVWTR
jgi:hypothetical protein